MLGEGTKENGNSVVRQMKIPLPNGIMCVILGAAGVVGVLLALWGTNRYGIGTSPDGVAYLSTAQNVADGKGFILHKT